MLGGIYNYSNVKRWSRRVPGQDIFELDKIFIPVNQEDGTHWGCAVIYVQDKKIQFYDSLHKNGEEYLRAIFQYLKDEWEDKRGGELPDAEQWTLITTRNCTPMQHNSFDCGVFTCMFADFISMGYDLAFNQAHIDYCRNRILRSVLNDAIID